MKNNDRKILMVFIEPTPYILGLIKELNLLASNKITVLFLKNNLTQKWDLPLEVNCSVLSKTLFKSIHDIFYKLSNNEYEIIHVAGWSNLFTLALFFLSKWFSVPLTVETDTIINPKTVWWKRVVKRIFYPILFKLPSIFFPGGTRQSLYIQHYNVPKEKIIIANMTVDVNKIRHYAISVNRTKIITWRDSYTLSKDDFVFLYVGRLEPYKGILEVINAFQKINRSKAKLVIVGDGSLRGYSEMIASLNENIFYVGIKKSEELFKAYLISDILVLYSPLDQWGLVVNEAMAFSKPVIISDQVGCSDDLVIPNKTGFIIPWGREDLLIESMRIFCDNPEIQQTMSKNAFELIAPWTLENEAKILLRTWQKLLLK